MEMDMKIDVNMKMDIDMNEDMKTWTRKWKHGRGHGKIVKFYEKIKRKTEAQVIFLNLFTGSLSLVRLLTKKYSVGSYPYANGQNGISHLRKKVSKKY